MRRRVIGATLTIVGGLVLLLVPVVGVSGCATCIAGTRNPICGCHDYGSYSWRSLIHYPPGWGDKLAWPMLIIGVALVVTGVVLMIKARRSRGLPSTARRALHGLFSCLPWLVVTASRLRSPAAARARAPA
jgi:hypothetical protein